MRPPFMSYKQLNQPNQPNNSQPRQFISSQVGQTFKRPIGLGLNLSMLKNAKPGCGSCGK